MHVSPNKMFHMCPISPSCLVLFPDPMRRSHIIVVDVVQIVATPLSETQGPGKDGIIHYFCL